MTKIGHISDIHIRGLRYLDEMEYTFEKLYESLRVENVDLIVVTGDIYHSKLTVTSEYFNCCANLFRNLTEIAPMIIILGNHDLALQNLNRLDALTPVIKALGTTTHPIYFEPRGEEKIEGFYFHTLSILDKKEDWHTQDTIVSGLDSGKYVDSDVHIALYHGSINDSVVDSGWVSRGNEDEITIFEGFDYGMLGDIHKFQMLTPRVGYPGSLRQNNFGESKDKGYLIWNIESKEDYNVDRIVLEQKRYFETITLDDTGDVPTNLEIKPGCRIRVKLAKRINISDDLKIREAVKRIYKPRNDVTTEPPKDAIQITDIQVGDSTISQENMRDLDVQRQLIEDFYKDEKLDDDTLQAIFNIDKKYNSYLDHDAARNVIWRIKKWKWENIFSYGKGNSINFSKLNGLVGVFGKNQAGKSSIFDGFCYSMFNKINKEGANKNVEYIHTRKKKCKFDVEIDFAGETHFIKRSTAKPKSKKGAPVNDIEFYKKSGKEKIDLNGAIKPETNANIKNKFGTLDEFVTTSLAPQEGLLQFLDKRGTDKKKLFATFLDVEIFEQKFKHADKDFSGLKSDMKQYDGINFHHAILDHEDELLNTRIHLDAEVKLKEKAEKTLEKLTGRIASLSVKMRDIDDDADLEEIERLIVKNQLEIDNIEGRILNLEESPADFENLSLEIESHKKDLDLIQMKLGVIHEVERDLKGMKDEAALLMKVPCGDEYSMCPFITKAHRAKAELRNFDESRLNAKTLLLADRERLEKILVEHQKLEKEAAECIRLTLKLENLRLKQDSFNHRRQSAEKIQGAIEANRHFIDQIRELKKQKEETLRSLGEYNKEILNASKRFGSQENELERLKVNQKKVEILREEYVAYQLYLKAMGKNGISYKIISGRLPLVNEEVNRILSQVSDLSLLIEDNQAEKSIKLYIVSALKGKRPVELGSGFEKTMISLALRTALWSISSLPKTPVLILDEPFAFVEEGKFGASVRMLNYLKNYFEHIFIISHNTNLKNIVDTSIYVSLDDDGFAHCNIG